MKLRNNVLRDFFLGSVKIYVLYQASRESIYGTALITDLAQHGYTLSPGTLYPVLHKLEHAGLLESERETIEGRMRRYYHTTQLGLQTLKAAQNAMRSLMYEVIEEKNHVH